MHTVGRLFIAAALSFVVLGCELVAPTRQNSYELVSVNGAPLPHTIAPLYSTDGKTRDLRYTRGSVTLFQEGRIAFLVIRQRYVDGLPEDTTEFPWRMVYTIAAGENPVNQGMRTNISNNTDSVRISSYWAFDREVFLFVRR